VGDAIGHRAYRSGRRLRLLLVFVQYLAAMDEQHSLWRRIRCNAKLWAGTPFRLQPLLDVFFIFSDGLTALTLATRRPLVEALPAAGITPAR